MDQFDSNGLSNRWSFKTIWTIVLFPITSILATSGSTSTRWDWSGGACNDLSFLCSGNCPQTTFPWLWWYVSRYTGYWTSWEDLPNDTDKSKCLTGRYSITNCCGNAGRTDQNSSRLQTSDRNESSTAGAFTFTWYHKSILEKSTFTWWSTSCILSNLSTAIHSLWWAIRLPRLWFSGFRTQLF